MFLVVFNKNWVSDGFEINAFPRDEEARRDTGSSISHFYHCLSVYTESYSVWQHVLRSRQLLTGTFLSTN